MIIDTKLGSRSVTFTLQKPFTMLWYLPIIDLIDLRLKQLILQFYLTNLRNYFDFFKQTKKNFLFFWNVVKSN